VEARFELKKSAVYGWTCRNGEGKLKFWLCGEVMDLLLKGANVRDIVLEISGSGDLDKGDFKLWRSGCDGPDKNHKLWKINGMIFVEFQTDARILLDSLLEKWDREVVFFRFLEETVIEKKAYKRIGR